MNCLYILNIEPLSVISFINIFPHSAVCIFILSMVLSGECVISSGLSHHSKNLKWRTLKPSVCHGSWTDQCYGSQTDLYRVLQLCVTAQFYLENKGKYILEAWGHANPKDAKRREREHAWERDPHPFGSSCYMLFPPLGLPCVNWASQSAVCSTWGPHSGPQTFLCSLFVGFSLSCLLATAILDSFFLF